MPNSRSLTFVGTTTRCVFSRPILTLHFERIFCLKGGHVRGSDNWAAQTFYDNLPVFYEKYKDTPKVIFYCQNSRSNARGPRSAGWCDFHTMLKLNVSLIRSKYLGTKIISTLKKAINRLPTFSKGASKDGLQNMVTMKTSLPKIDFPSTCCKL